MGLLSDEEKVSMTEDKQLVTRTKIWRTEEIAPKNYSQDSCEIESERLSKIYLHAGSVEEK